MKAVSPVLPNSPYFEEVVLAKDQSKYLPLPVALIPYTDGTQSMISSYKLTLIERFRILLSGRVWWEQLTFGGQLQPQKMYVSEPFL
jgi:hypothetical protein